MAINLEKLLDQFDKEYEFLYEADGRGAYVAGYREALEEGDRIIRENHDLIRAFARLRGDILTSDREVAAFAFALYEVLSDEPAVSVL